MACPVGHVQHLRAGVDEKRGKTAWDHDVAVPFVHTSLPREGKTTGVDTTLLTMMPYRGNRHPDHDGSEEVERQLVRVLQQPFDAMVVSPPVVVEFVPQSAELNPSSSAKAMRYEGLL